MSSLPIALMSLLLEHEDLDAVEQIIGARGDAELRALFVAHRSGCARIVDMLRAGLDVPGQHASAEAGVDATRRLFDDSVQRSEESSVALYSLGSPQLLAQATAEIVAWMQQQALVAATARVLQIGCGIGRIEAALGPLVREAVGIDVSPKMIEAARRRVQQSNVRFERTEGFDLRLFAAASFELVYAVDSFPYLVQAGPSLVDTHFAEARRVLMEGGRFAILNFSYRTLEEDRRDVEALAAQHGFALSVNGETPFSLWNGAVFVMQHV